MADSRVLDAMQEQGRMESARTNFDTFWQDVADRVDPAAGYFVSSNTPGKQRAEKQFDSTATIALSRATAAFESLVAPRTAKWHGLVPSNESLRDDQAVKVYLDALRGLMFKVRYSSRGNFANQNNEFLRSTLCFGNGVMYVDDDPGRSLRYKNIALPESYFSEDHSGVVDRFHRKFKMPARLLPKKFGEDALNDRLRKLAKNEPDKDVVIIHRVCDNYDRDPKRKDYAGAPLLGSYIIPDEQVVVDVAGFRSMPYLVGRYRVLAREIYGRGPVMDILASIRVINEMQKTNMRAGQRIADPPLLAYRDGVAGFSLRSGHLNFGFLDERGNELVKPMQTANGLPVALEMQNAEREIVNSSMLIEIFKLLADNPQMTATQVLQLVQERGVLMGPSAGNIQSTYGRMIEREIELLSAIGGGAWLESQIGPMPDALRDAGGAYEIEFDAPINKAQKAEEGIAILQTIQDATPLSQIDPSVLKVFDVKKALRRLAEIRGFPADLLRTDDDIEQDNEEAANEQQLQQLLAAAPVVSGSVKNLAQAQAAAGTSPQASPLAL